MNSGHTTREKASALLGILLFCFQLGAADLLPDGAASLSCAHTRVWLSSSSGSAGESAAVAESDSVITTPAPQSDDGDSIWQCPGTVDGIALTPPQPYRPPVTFTGWISEPVWNNSSEQRVFLSQGYFPARFQPPESRSL